MKLSISPQSSIYVVCPAQFATGGPEALHQLVYKLRRLGHQAFMRYLPVDHPDPVHPQFTPYDNPFSRELEDRPENVLIVPETMPELLESYHQVQKVLWWLSVDNHYDQLFKRSRRYKVYKKLNKLKKDLVDMEAQRALYAQKATLPAPYTGYLHLVQSEYARQHLLAKKISSVEYLSCYLNDEFIYRERSSMKRDIVLYNPNKGYRFTQRLIAAAPEIEWIPIRNMTRAEVAELLAQAKVYVDFGCHPGKDRIPREAAISGVCVITGKAGSASYSEDVPIPNEFKFPDESRSVGAVIARIKQCLVRFEEHSSEFDAYRESIRAEQSQFEEDLLRIFGPAPK